jgi:hypothetical protein
MVAGEARMTTPAEKVALDVIFAALDGMTHGQAPKKALTAKLALVFGVAVFLCREQGISETLAMEFLEHRWDEYSEQFGHDA